MATAAQRRAARRNVRKAQRAANEQRTVAHLPRSVRSGLGQEAAKARRRGGRPGHRLEDRSTNELYDLAKEKGIRGRSRMGKWELIDAIRRS